jgi:hypothetical protein
MYCNNKFLCKRHNCYQQSEYNVILLGWFKKYTEYIDFGNEQAHLSQVVPEFLAVGFSPCFVRRLLLVKLVPKKPHFQ